MTRIDKIFLGTFLGLIGSVLFIFLFNWWGPAKEGRFEVLAREFVNDASRSQQYAKVGRYGVTGYQSVKTDLPAFWVIKLKVEGKVREIVVEPSEAKVANAKMVVLKYKILRDGKLGVVDLSASK